MKVNNFNSKVNVPKFCAKLGYTDYQFTRVPTFGWFAYNKDMSFVGTIFDLVKAEEQEILYSMITKENVEYLDFDLAFSDLANTKLQYNLLEIRLWKAVYAMSKVELKDYRVNYQGKKVPLVDALAANGMLGVLDNGIGVITSRVLEKFHMLPWPKKDLRGKILIPSFCAPGHICSLEYSSWDRMGELHPLWLNDEKGWYGNIKAKHVISDIKEFCTTPGITWDYKADLWTNNEVFTLSEFLDVGDCIKIWTDTKHSTFAKSPLLHVVETGKASELKNYVGKLNFTQLQQAEQLTGEKLLSYWKRAREHQVQIGDRTFAKRDNRYYVYKKGTLQEVTNFAIDVERIVKTTKGFVRVGHLHFGNQSVPFEMDEEYFTTNYKFHRGMKEKFLNAGLGVPIVHPDFFNKALLIIDSFNPGVQVVLEDASSSPDTREDT